jgi:hypothetical protein
MNPDKLQDVVAVLALLIPVLGLSIGGLFVLARSRIGEALARRIAGERRDPDYEARLLELEDELALLRGQLLDTQERLDFTERRLARPELPQEPRP